ncbi:hypothetical protein C3L33_04404, partial [Rhododendron williamsianum]
MMVFFMKISVNTGALSVLIYIFIWLMLTSSFSYGIESDINCLKSLKASLEDPFNYLSSWDFNNATEGFICKFTGIDCWHPEESKVLNIRLSDMELKGEFPRGLKNCSALTGLDLSSNKFYGTIPSDFSAIVPFNKLSGQIPLELVLLSRLKSFSAANNLLSGSVPNFKFSIQAENYANNAGLCGGPLTACQGASRKPHSGILVGAAVGGVTIAAFGVAIAMFFYMRRVSRKKKEDDPDGNKWAKSLKGAKAIKFLKVACSCVIPAAKERPTMFEVYQLLRAIGERYHFSMDDDILMASDTSNADYLEELIVAREGIESH